MVKMWNCGMPRPYQADGAYVQLVPPYTRMYLVRIECLRLEGVNAWLSARVVGVALQLGDIGIFGKPRVIERMSGRVFVTLSD